MLPPTLKIVRRVVTGAQYRVLLAKYGHVFSLANYDDVFTEVCGCTGIQTNRFA